MKGRMDDVERRQTRGKTNQPLTMGPQRAFFLAANPPDEQINKPGTVVKGACCILQEVTERQWFLLKKYNNDEGMNGCTIHVYVAIFLQG